MMEMTKKNVFRMISAFLICLCVVLCLKTADAQAASKKMATESSGKYTYYSIQGTIWRMDTGSGKSEEIRTIEGTNCISDISYYKGYLYFTADNYYYSNGGDGSEAYICRMKTNGEDFDRLGCGMAARIYNGKIYYLYGTIEMYGTTPSTEIKGIARMNLNGDSKKKLVTGKARYTAFEIVKNRIYYTASNSNGAAKYLYRVNMSGKKSKTLVSSDVRQLLSDGTNIYYATAKELHRIAGSSGKDKHLLNLAWKRNIYPSSVISCTSILEVKSGVIYFLDYYSGYKLRKYTISKNKITNMKTFQTSVTDMVVGKGKYAVIRRKISGSSKYTEAVGRIKTTGKNYKDLKKYYGP